MRILTGEEFLKEPFGVTYINFIPQMYIGEPMIKESDRGSNSWYSLDVLPWVELDNEFNIWDNNKSYELKTEGFCTDDATYNRDSNVLYAVFNKEEVQDMISRLTESLKSY